MNTVPMPLAFVVQRYGPEVNGGAELLCRQVAERLKRSLPIEVLTTCALDHGTWRNEYPAGETTIHGIPVRRFPVEYPRRQSLFRFLSLLTPHLRPGCLRKPLPQVLLQRTWMWV
jgi:hypothetical protein